MTCPLCDSENIVTISPIQPGPLGWSRRCKDCGERWDIVASEEDEETE